MTAGREPKLIYGGRPVCNNENPRRCRKTAVWYMDGMFYCDEHLDAVPEFLRTFIFPIRWVKQ